MAGLILGLVQACTVPSCGFTGLSVDEDGQPVVLLALCEGYIDSIQFAELGSGPGQQVYGITRDEPIWKSTTISLTSPADGWSVGFGSLDSLQPGTSYRVFGGTSDNEWSTIEVTFTLERLSRIKPGQVMWMRFGERDEYTVVGSKSKFEQEACS